ncbi:MAG: hypothetical protein UV18_C0011G0002 [Candidatus Magasanikbacteria bacterium GW2011_GWC2_42_27]|nr:MAG: hypothetical protein UV18_C0011G0002 [Candidatus Magasanikbacteria bacterium GW2011_GWC2_42_27]
MHFTLSEPRFSVARIEPTAYQAGIREPPEQNYGSRGTNQSRKLSSLHQHRLQGRRFQLRGPILYAVSTLQ